MNEQKEDIQLIKEYLKSDGILIYKDIVDYIKDTTKSNRRVDMYRIIFGNESLSDPLLAWIKSKCKSKEFIELISRVYGINEAYLYMIRSIVTFDVMTESEFNKLIEIVSNNKIIQELKFLESMLDKVYIKLKEELNTEESKRLIDKVRNETTMQLSLF